MYTYNNEILSQKDLQNRLGISFPANNPPEPWVLGTPAALKLTLTELKQLKGGEIDSEYAQELAVILNQYPEAEKLTWNKQEKEAREYLADATASIPYLEKLAAARGIIVQELAEKVVANADAWIELSANATGKRQRLQQQVSDAETKEDLDAITWLEI